MAGSVDVVIPTYNKYELTEGCLRTLVGQTLTHRVTVVDNGSSDGTPERLRKDWPDVEVECLGENHGFAIAANAGVAKGSAETVVLLNNDVQCRPDFLERLVAPLRDRTM